MKNTDLKQLDKVLKDESVPKFNQEQYDLLMCCSQKRDLKEWNEWRRKNLLDIDVLLEGACLNGAYLKGADLRAVHLEGALLCQANLEEADLFNAHLDRAQLYRAHLVRANVRGTRLEKANLEQADLEGAELYHAHLEEAELRQANLKHAYVFHARLEGTQFLGANLENTTFIACSVDGATLFWNCSHNEDTYFIGVGLASAGIHPGLREKFEGYTRRKRWRDWCKKRVWRRLVLLFWWFSDYGRSTVRPIESFFLVVILSTRFGPL